MILLVGGNGSIGRRYQAVLKYLDEPFMVYDAPSFPHGIHKWKFDKAIIAVPTEHHGMYCRLLSNLKKPFLCEKPLSMNLEEAKDIAENCDGFVVNNYEFLNEFILEKDSIKKIEYNFYNTGKDGLIWDVCQLVLIAKKLNAKLDVKRLSPFWNLRLNFLEVRYREIEWSYVSMVRAFLKNEIYQLWDLKDGYLMSLLCEDLNLRGGNDCEAFIWDSKIDEFQCSKNMQIMRNIPGSSTIF